MGTVSKKL